MSFGALATTAGLSVPQALVLSLLMFADLTGVHELTAAMLEQVSKRWSNVRPLPATGGARRRTR